MRIDRLELKNFRCFENLEMQLHPRCNILVGINGAGKSNLQSWMVWQLLLELIFQDLTV